MDRLVAGDRVDHRYVRTASYHQRRAEDSSSTSWGATWSDNLAGYTPLWPLLLIAGGYTAWKAIRGDAIWQFYAAALVVQVPVCLLVTVEGFSLRQFLTAQTLLLCALGAFVVEVCAVAAAETRNFHDWLAGAVAALARRLPAAVSRRTGSSSSQGARQWTLLDRTSRVKAENVRALREYARWIGGRPGTFPAGENILLLEVYSNYQVFLDGGKHGWVPLQLDCGVGLRNPTTRRLRTQRGCRRTRHPSPRFGSRSKKTARPSPYPCQACMEQLEQSESEYLLVSHSFKYPGISGFGIVSCGKRRVRGCPQGALG